MLPLIIKMKYALFIAQKTEATSLTRPPNPSLHLTLRVGELVVRHEWPIGRIARAWGHV
jgi:hypothetical protein